MPNVLVVDDSAVDAKLFSRIIEKIPGVNVVALSTAEMRLTRLSNQKLIWSSPICKCCDGRVQIRSPVNNPDGQVAR
jgi:CheY-like chemotaxis protein